MPHDLGALILFGVAILALVVALAIFCACVCSARDDRLIEAWRAERERNAAALGD